MNLNCLICSWKSGDVIGLCLKQLVGCPHITKIMVADGPHLGNIKPGHKCDSPTVHEVVQELDSDKIIYEYTDDCEIRSEKNNRILVHADCDWIINVDSDEIWHEDGLLRLADFLENDPPYDRYEVKTINPYPDFHHQFFIYDWKPRVYRWFEGAKCGASDRHHQYVNHKLQKRFPRGIKELPEGMVEAKQGMAHLPEEIATIFHLNALREMSGTRRVRPLEDGTVIYRGGRTEQTSEIHPLDILEAPRSIRELGRDTLL
jgi:hypothetical protein